MFSSHLVFVLSVVQRSLTLVSSCFLVSDILKLIDHMTISPQVKKLVRHSSGLAVSGIT